MAAKRASTRPGRSGRKEESGWFGPVLIALAIVMLVGFTGYQIWSGEKRRAEAEAEEAAAKQQPPELRGFPAAAAAHNLRAAASLHRDEAQQLARHGLEWLLRWSMADDAIEAEALIFEREDGAEAFFARDGGRKVDELLGEEAVLKEDGRGLWVRRGRVVTRFRPEAGSMDASGAGQLLEAARELDMAVVRTWGADPA
jgi:hypothetical protein